MANLVDEEARMEVDKLKSIDLGLFISPNPDLAQAYRKALQYVFKSLKPCTPDLPIDQLYTEGFDAEQIWQQLDLQSQKRRPYLKKQVWKILDQKIGRDLERREIKEDGNKNLGLELEGDDDSLNLEGLSDEDEDEDEDERENVDDEEEGVDDDDDDDDDDDESGEGEEYDDDDGVPEVEDDFLKIKDLEKYLVREEEKEYGTEDKTKNKKKGMKSSREGAYEEDESDAAVEEDELLMYAGGDEDDKLGANIKYGDFFVPEKKTPKRKWTQGEELNDPMMKDEKSERKNGNLSTHEKELLKIQAKIKEMEEANLDPKEWTMQGEVTASKRPKDSALEFDFDFEHNVMPAPVITEEQNVAIEEMIRQRIIEGRFDDVQRAPKLLSAAPKEIKELDDNKSKRGLADVYEEEYARQTGLPSAPISSNDKLRNEARSLFKKLCVKLDALSHFHFAPKPVIEDMSIQVNTAALAMEEIAPMAVSDAAMLAPEEVFAGKGDIKEETELTKENKKRRRAKWKREWKRENKPKNVKRSVKPATEKPLEDQS